MNLKNRTTVVFVILLVVVFFSLEIWQANEFNKYRKRIADDEESKSAVFDSIRIEYLKLYSPVYNYYSNNKASIRETLGNKTSVLIYRFSKYTCDACLHEDLQEIELLQKEVGKDKILLLPAYPDTRIEKFVLLSVLERFNYMNIPLDSWTIPLYYEDGNKTLHRYFAVIDEGGNLTMVFFPRRGEINLIRRYFSEVKKLICEKEFKKEQDNDSIANSDDLNPEIFDEKVIDLGIVKMNQTQEIKFKYTNRLSKSLVIYDVKTSCGCSVPHWDKKPLEKNESSFLAVSFTPELSGYNSKTIMVFHNQSENPVQLLFKAMVE
jgi:hypothetical protein